MNYRRITSSEREQIAQMLTLDMDLTAIARALGRNKSSVSREVARIEKQGRAYSAFEAQADAEKKASQRASRCKLDRKPALWTIVKEYLAKRWSPEQIAAYLKQQYLQHT